MAYLKDARTGRRVHIPSEEEDAVINQGIADDPETRELDEAWFTEAKPTAEIPELVAILKANGKWGRPPLPEGERKQRVTLYLDRDVLDRLKEGGKGWQTRANAALRKTFGL